MGNYVIAPAGFLAPEGQKPCGGNYAGSPKVPPRVFGPLGPKTLRGQLHSFPYMTYSR